MRRALDDVRQPVAALQVGLRANVALALEQQVISADESGIVIPHLRRYRLAVQPLLQIREGAGEIVGSRGATDQQFAIHHAFEFDGVKHIRESTGNIVAGAGIELSRFAGPGQLHTDTVPFPLCCIVGGIQRIEIAIGDRCRQHHRMEDGGRCQQRAVGVALQPGE